MDREVVIDTPTKYAHTQFVGWLNNLLNNYTNGFWDEPVKSLLNASFLRESQLYFQELYSPSGDSYDGFFVVMNTDSMVQWLLLFDKDGVPVYYTDSNVETNFEVSLNGILTRFWPNTSLPLTDGNVSDRVLAVFYEEWFGVKFPMVYVKLNDGTNVSKGILDILYEGRTSGTYTCKFWPEDTVPTFLVTNMTNMKLDLTVPLSDTSLVKYTLSANGTAFIPKTAQSEKYLRDLQKLKTVKFRLYAN